MRLRTYFGFGGFFGFEAAGGDAFGGDDAAVTAIGLPVQLREDQGDRRLVLDDDLGRAERPGHVQRQAGAL